MRPEASALVGRVVEDWEPGKHPRGVAGRFIDVAGRLAAGESQQSIVKDLERQMYDAPHGEVFDVGGIKATKVVKPGKSFQPGGPIPGNHMVDVAGEARSRFPSVAAGPLVQRAVEKAASDAAPKPEPTKKGGKNVLTHVLPDGTVETRETTRAYTHVTTSTGHESDAKPGAWRHEHYGIRRVVGWHLSKENADKAAAARGKTGWENVKVEEINGRKT